MATFDSLEYLPKHLKTVTNAFALLLIVDPFQIMYKGKIIKEVELAVGSPQIVDLLYLSFHKIFLENNNQLRHTFFGNELVRLLWT